MIARSGFRDIRWMTSTPHGVVYLIDGVDLVRITADGKVKTIARQLSDGGVLRPWASKPHQLMGLWTDRAGNTYVADYASGVVKRIDNAGRVSVIARSSYPWSPTGGVFDREGNLWLLEYTINSARVRKVSGQPKTR